MFVPHDLDAARWDLLAPLYGDLLARPLRGVADLERLLLDRSELDAAASEAADELEIAATRRLEESTQADYLAFVEAVQPECRRVGFELDRRIISCMYAAELEPRRYAVLLRDLGADVELFQPDNLPLETELSRLEQEYQQVCGAWTVQLGGEEQTVARAGRLLEETDRDAREDAWRAIHDRRSRDSERLDAIFDRMIHLRHRVARKAGFRDFRDYQHRRLRRFDYTPADCERFHDGVAEVVVPLLRRLQRERALALGVDVLRPWDLAVDVAGRDPLRPFANISQLVARTSRVFHRLRPDLGALFDELRDGDCLDLEARKNKAPGGYHCLRQRTRRPFIFMNAVGVHRDVVALVHEAGHAFHAALCKDEPLLHYRKAPMEFSEVASMSMEMLTLPLLDEYYDVSAAERARRHHLEELVSRLAWVAQVDAFQHYIYTHPQHTRSERGAAWVRISERFGGEVSWKDTGELLPCEWQRQLHVFCAPFYYIEYGIAQLGALQLWSQSQRSRDGALDNYTRALALGGSRPVPELYAAAGLRFDLGIETMRSAIGEVDGALMSAQS